MIQDIAPHQFDVAYTHEFLQKEDLVLLVVNGQLICRKKEGELSFFTGEALSFLDQSAAIYLFSIDKIRYFGMFVGEEEIRQIKERAGEEEVCWLKRGELRYSEPLWKSFAGITGLQILKFYEDNQFCGACQTQMEISLTERAMICPKCGRVKYPHLAPSVIVGITHKDRILLTRYAVNREYRKYALVAGYVEVGETLEDAVRREVKEEVGLSVKNIRYYKSQPWGFSGALLVGFFAELEGEDETVTLQEEELCEATWFDREHRPDDIRPRVSLTNEMIDLFFRGEERVKTELTHKLC